MEFPGFLVDFRNQAQWKPRPCPSPEALAESIAVKGRVVWLTYLPEEIYGGEELPAEAVVIKDFLGKYGLVKTVV